MFWYDSTYFLVLIGLALSLAASGYVKSTYSKYSQTVNRKGISGSEVAQKILADAGVYDVTVRSVSGDLTDNYNSQKKMVSLSHDVYQSTSIAAISVAAHECGHAIQDSHEYIPLRLRAAIVPIANFGSTISMPLIFLGVIMGWSQSLINLGILCFSLAFLFQLVTLPVEFNASRRALVILNEGDYLNEDELVMARKMLTAAALTYVAGAIATFLQLLRLVLLFGNNNRRR